MKIGSRLLLPFPSYVFNYLFGQKLELCANRPTGRMRMNNGTNYRYEPIYLFSPRKSKVCLYCSQRIEISPYFMRPNEIPAVYHLKMKYGPAFVNEPANRTNARV
jgi:hypothetical protein